MSAPALPEGWEEWSPAAKARLHRVFEQAKQEHAKPLWYCEVPGCDGQPHEGRPYSHARVQQVPPAGDWLTWLVLAGRGFGKTRTGAEWAHRKARWSARGALVAPTNADIRDVMVEGESGILATARPSFRPEYEPSKRRVTWPNGHIATTYSAEEPDRLRGPQHEWAWCDELAAWKALDDTLDNLQLGLRLGPHPEILATTTPRPRARIKALVADPFTVVTRGSTYDNLHNLAPSFRAQIVSKYEGTRLGRQELMAELLTDVPGALWTWAMFEEPHFRLDPRDPTTPAVLDAFTHGCVAVDPAVTSLEGSDGTGIVAACTNGQAGIVLAAKEVRETPVRCMEMAVDMALRADVGRIVVERNNGGDYLTSVARQVIREHDDPEAKNLRVSTVVATRGKAVRAQPVAALYEQQRIMHLGEHAELETQLTSWADEPGQASPNLLDALVWAFTDLMLVKPAPPPARGIKT